MSRLYFACRRRWLLLIPIHRAGSRALLELYAPLHRVTRRTALILNRGGYRTVTAVRHPYERVRSALSSVLFSGRDPLEQFWRNRDNTHLMPQSEWLEGFANVELILLERLPIRRNASRLKVEFDFAPIAHLYREDLELWQRASR